MNGETLTGLLKKGQMILAQAGIKEAGLDAWLLLEYDRLVTIACQMFQIKFCVLSIHILTTLNGLSGSNTNETCINH